MKKTKMFALMCVITVLFTGCGAGKPEKVVESAIQCLQENNLEEVRQYFAKGESAETIMEADSEISGDVGSESEESVFSNSMMTVMEECAKENAEFIRYEITDTRETGEDEAKVTVKVTYKDAGPVAKIAMNALYEQIVSSAITGAFTGEDVDMEDSDMAAIFTKAFENAKETASYVDKTESIDIGLKKVDGQWKIIDATGLMNVYYCNILNTFEKFFSSETEESGENEEETETENTGDMESGSDADVSEASDDSDIRLFEDEGLRNTKEEYAIWDDEGELYVTMVYIGTNSKNQYVGNCTIEFTDAEGTQSLEGTFVENSGETGTMTYNNGKSASYRIEWNTDHSELIMELDGEEYYLLEAQWAYGNVG